MAAAEASRETMRRTASRRRVSIGPIVCVAWLLGSAQATEDAPSGIPFPPEVASRRFEVPEGRALKRAGIALYAAGALYDLYTSKRAMDAGLREANPLLNGSDDPNRTLATAAAVKVGFAFVIGTVGPRGGERARGAWYLACGGLQIGYGLINRNATIREREASLAGPPSTPVEPAPSPPSPASAPLRGSAASSRWKIGK
jgi:hypothetical protein